MKISFNPSNSNKNILDLIKNNKDIIFDLKGHSIFARGVEFKGTDTNTWRDIKINNVSIGSHTLDLRNGSNTTLTNTNGVVTINSTWRPVVDSLTSNSTTSSLSAKQGEVLKALIDGKSDSGHTHDGRYVRYYAVTTLDCNNLAAGLTVARVKATNAGAAYHSAYLYISDIETPFQIQIPDSDVPYIYKRYYSSGKWSGWFKLNAGYADSAGSVAWANVTGKPSSYTPSAHTHAWNSLTHSSTTENQAILTNGKANGWKLYTLNISGWNNAANNAHSHANKSVLDGITSGLVNNWNTAYTFVNTITGTDTDKVINKWEEIVNFLAGITEDNKLNTLLNSKLSIQQLSAKDILTTKTNNALFWVDTIGNARTITTGPFTDHPYALLSVTNYNQNAENHKFFYRSRLAFNSVGDIKVASCHHENEYQQDETWYNVLTSKNSGINGSTIKLNGTSITVYSSSTADSRYVKKSGDTMSGVLTIDTTNFGALTIKRNDDVYGASIQFRGKSSVYGYIGLNNSAKDKQFLRWSSDTSRVYTILDTSSTYISKGKGYINGTEITQVNNSDTLDGYHETKFFRHRGNTKKNESPLKYTGGTLEYYGNLPSGMSNVYNWGGSLVSGGEITSLQFYYPDPANDKSIYARTFWDNKDSGWHKLAFADSKVADSDKLDGVHLNGIFTEFSYAQSRLTATIGTVSKTVNVTGSYPSTRGVTMNTIASYGNCMGMADLVSRNSNVNPNNQTSWHHFINISYNTESTDMWQTQFANKAGTTEVWVRSRAGGSISDSSAWAAPWVRLARITDNVASATNADMVDGYHATDGRIFNGDIHWGSWNDVWSDGTHTHPWYGFDHRYPNTGAYSTTISDYCGMTIKTYNTLLLDCGTLLLNSRNNVGIGTTSPTQKLDVAGNIRATGQIIREGHSEQWVYGRNAALLRETSVAGYHTLWSLKTTDGSWDFGEYNAGSDWNNIPVLSYVTDSNYNSGNNATTYQIKFPLASGTVALTSSIPNPTNYYWANVKISTSSSTTTSPTVSNLTATNSIRMGDILLENTDEIDNSANGHIYLNYRHSGNVNLCQGGGNVGIGAMYPAYKLDVNGQIRASGFHHASHNDDSYVLLAGGGTSHIKQGSTQWSTAIQFGDYVWLMLEIGEASNGIPVVPTNISNPTRDIQVMNSQLGTYSNSRHGRYRVAPNGVLYYVDGVAGMQIYTTICYVVNNYII